MQTLATQHTPHIKAESKIAVRYLKESCKYSGGLLTVNQRNLAHLHGSNLMALHAAVWTICHILGPDCDRLEARTEDSAHSDERVLMHMDANLE